MKIFLFDSDEVLPAIGVIEPKQKDELSRLDFGKPIGELGCYLNYTDHDPVPCTERQCELIKELGYIVPEGLTRISGKDSICSPKTSLIELANELKIKMSAFIGSDELMHSIVTSSSERDRAALYCYAVYQNIVGKPFGNMFSNNYLDSFYSFADIVNDDPSLKRSLYGRQIAEYTTPKTTVKIYRAAIEHLRADGIV